MTLLDTSAPVRARAPGRRMLTTSACTVLEHLDVITGGRSHRLHLARMVDTGRTVIIKTGGNAAKLTHEAGALAALATAPGAPCPRLIESSLICFGTAPRPCLILEHLPGAHPQTLEEHQLLGAALAELHNIPLTAALHVFHRSPAQLLRLARDLAAGLTPPLSDVVERISRPRRQCWPDQVLIHGDAASNNALITSLKARRVVLIDYENAVLAHPGLDLGRLVFLIDLTDDAPPKLTHERIQAVLIGYARQRHVPDDLTSWLITAGLQIAAWRQAHRTRAGVPPAEGALDRLHYWAKDTLNA